MQVQHAEVAEHKGLKKSSCQPLKLTASLEKLDGLDKEDTGVFYDEMTSSSYPTSLKSSKHSVTLPPMTAAQKYPSLAQLQKQQEELLPLYSFPDKSKKENKHSPGTEKVRGTELAKSQSLLVRSQTESMAEQELIVQGADIRIIKQPKSPSPPPPMLPPKLGQAGKVAESIQEELKDDGYEYIEVSSRPITCLQPRNRAPGAIGTTVSPLHLISQNPSSTEREKGSFRRSYSMEGIFEGEALQHPKQKVSDLDFRQLHDTPMNPNLHTWGMAPHQERQ